MQALGLGLAVVLGLLAMAQGYWVGRETTSSANSARYLKTWALLLLALAVFLATHQN